MPAELGGKHQTDAACQATPAPPPSLPPAKPAAEEEEVVVVAAGQVGVDDELFFEELEKLHRCHWKRERMVAEPLQGRH